RRSRAHRSRALSDVARARYDHGRARRPPLTETSPTAECRRILRSPSSPSAISPKRQCGPHLAAFDIHGGITGRRPSGDPPQQRRSVMNKSVCAFLVFALACLVCAIPVALADPQFSERDIKGPYGFAFDGFVGAPGTTTGNSTPVASVGRFTADGRGHLEDGVR